MQNLKDVRWRGCLVAILAGLAGICVGTSFIMFAITTRLFFSHELIHLYWNIPALAAIILLPILMIAWADKDFRSKWRIMCCFTLGTFGLMLAWGEYEYNQFRKIVLANDSIYTRSVIALANAHSYPTPVELKAWKYWYWSLVPAPYGGGARYYSLGGSAGQCMIMSNPDGVWPLNLLMDTYPVPPGTQVRHPDAWARGTLAHELAHCFDANADSNPDYTKRSSLPPYLVNEPKDAIEQSIIENRKDVVLWKEAVADILQVGYWRLTEGDKEVARLLAKELNAGRKARAKGKDADFGHATSCWLERLEGEPDPPSLESLFTWANDIRFRVYMAENSGCRQKLKALSKMY